MGYVYAFIFYAASSWRRRPCENIEKNPSGLKLIKARLSIGNFKLITFQVSSRN